MIETLPSYDTSTAVFYVVFGFAILIFGLFSLIVKDKLFLSEAFVATCVGIIVGPVGLNLFKINDIMDEKTHLLFLEIVRLVVGIQCLAAGIASPGNYINKERVAMFLFLGPIMLTMWIISSIGVKVICDVDWWYALLIGACLTPTDPVLANSIVRGKFAEKRVPIHIRQILSNESAANDGMGIPFLLFPLYFQKLSPGLALGHWLGTITYQVGGSIVVGIIIGLLARYTLRFSEEHNWIDKESMLTFSLALSFGIIGMLDLLGMDDVLGCYVAGLTISWDNWFNQQIQDSHIQDVLDNVFNFCLFIYVGMLIPWRFYSHTYLLLILWLIFLRRVPIVMSLYKFIPVVVNMKEGFFCGWFGPMGAGALFYAMLLVTQHEIATDILPPVFFSVLGSVIIHGGTIGVFEIALKNYDDMDDFAM